MKKVSAGETKVTEAYTVDRYDECCIKFGHFGWRIHIGQLECYDNLYAYQLLWLQTQQHIV